MRSPILVLVAACAVALTGACKKTSTTPSPPGGGGGGGTTTATVNIPRGDGYTSSSFAPGSLSIAVGTTVTWNNQDQQAHTVTSNTNLFADTLSAGGSATRRFDTRGTFDYRCTLHSGMTGTVIVQ